MKLQEINAVLYLMQETNREMVIFIKKTKTKNPENIYANIVHI